MHQDSLATAANMLEPALETTTSRAALLTHLKKTSNTSNGADVPIRAAFEMLECAVALRLHRSENPGPPCLEALLTLCSSLPTHSRGKLVSIGFADFQKRTGLELEGEGGEPREELPPIQRWLNRILALPIGIQNAVFDEFLGLVEARVAKARDAGTLDLGVETIVVETLEIVSEKLLRTDKSGATTRLLEVAVTPRNAHGHNRFITVTGSFRWTATSTARSSMPWLKPGEIWRATISP